MACPVEVSLCACCTGWAWTTFQKPDAINTWKQKLNTELRNKITFDMHPTTCIPQIDVATTTHNTSTARALTLEALSLAPLGGLQPDCSADQPVPGPRQPTANPRAQT
eukprot:1138589-Pelagomonas_calceolata.AAC.1